MIDGKHPYTNFDVPQDSNWEYEREDRLRLSALRDEFRRSLPAPYSVAAESLDLSDAETMRTLQNAVGCDEDLTDDAKFALMMELAMRGQAARFAKIPAGESD